MVSLNRGASNHSSHTYIHAVRSVVWKALIEEACKYCFLSLYVNTVYIQTLFMFKDFFFSFFPTHTRSLYKSFFIYTRRSHTQEFLFTHYLHTQNPSIHIFFYIYKKLFSFLCIHRHDICSQRFFLIFGVITILVHFIFRTTFLNENSTRFRNFNKHYRQ